MGLYIDQNRKTLRKACSRSNLVAKFGAIDSSGPGECNTEGTIIQKNFENFFYDRMITLDEIWATESATDKVGLSEIRIQLSSPR